jgi:hypothetical protein
MSDVTDLGTLQSAVEYATVRKSVKIFGAVALLFGAIHLLLGATPPADLIQVGFGGLLVGAGLYNVATPRPIGLALAGGLLVLVGILNIFDAVSAAAAGNTGPTWAVIGVFQILWGINEFRRYKRFRNAFAAHPEDSVLEYAKELIQDLRKARPKDESDVLEFSSSGGMQARVVRIRLMPESALCLVGGGDDVMLVTPDDIEIADNGKVLIGSKRKVAVSVGDQTFKGQMPQEFVERFRTWKMGSALAQAA